MSRTPTEPSVDDLVASVVFGDAVSSLRRLAELAKIGERTEQSLRALYHDSIDPAPKLVIGKLCDEYIDRSGALLGRVRNPA